MKNDYFDCLIILLSMTFSMLYKGYFNIKKENPEQLTNDTTVCNKSLVLISRNVCHM